MARSSPCTNIQFAEAGKNALYHNRLRARSRRIIACETHQGVKMTKKIGQDTPPLLMKSQPSPVPIETGKVRPITFADLDRRTGAFRAAERKINEIIEDLGGEKEVSAAKRELVQRTAVLGAVLEDLETRWLGGAKFDVRTYLAATNCQHRLLRTIGLEPALTMSEMHNRAMNFLR